MAGESERGEVASGGVVSRKTAAKMTGAMTRARRRQKFGAKFWRWCDGFVLAGKGILLATREKKFWLGALPAFLLFGTLINLLSGGVAKFQLMGAAGIAQSLKIIGEAMLGVLGYKMIFLDWLPMFGLALMQGVLIGLIVLLWDKKRVRAGKSGKIPKAEKTRRAVETDFTENVTSLAKAKDAEDAEKTGNAANVEKAGIITGLIALGAGCPTCGTTLAAPLLGAIFSTGGVAMVGVVSGAVTALAVIVAILSLKKLGEEAYVIIVNERYLKKREARNAKGV